MVIFNYRKGSSINFDTKHTCARKKINLFFMVVGGLFVGCMNGLFGGGGGMICVPLLTKMGLKQKNAQATTMFVMLPISIASMSIYITHSGFDISQNYLIILGMIAGGFIGARLLKKLNNRVLRIIFAALIIFAGVRMLF